jgi:hypothetical protein
VFLRVQKHYKNVLQKIMSKGFYKKTTKIDKNPKPIYLDFLSRFWAFLGVKGVQKQLKNIGKNKSDPGPFLVSDPPTHHRGHRFFFFAAPCVTHPPVKIREWTNF